MRPAARLLESRRRRCHFLLQNCAKLAAKTSRPASPPRRPGSVSVSIKKPAGFAVGEREEAWPASRVHELFMAYPPSFAAFFVVKEKGSNPHCARFSGSPELFAALSGEEEEEDTRLSHS